MRLVDFSRLSRALHVFMDPETEPGESPARRKYPHLFVAPPNAPVAGSLHCRAYPQGFVLGAPAGSKLKILTPWAQMRQYDRRCKAQHLAPLWRFRIFRGSHTTESVSKKRHSGAPQRRLKKTALRGGPFQR